MTDTGLNVIAALAIIGLRRNRKKRGVYELAVPEPIRFLGQSMANVSARQRVEASGTTRKVDSAVACRAATSSVTRTRIP